MGDASHYFFNNLSGLVDAFEGGARHSPAEGVGSGMLREDAQAEGVDRAGRTRPPGQPKAQAALPYKTLAPQGRALRSLQRLWQNCDVTLWLLAETRGRQPRLCALQ